MTVFTFDAKVAYSPLLGALAQNVVGSIFLETDTAYATALTVTPQGGSPSTLLQSLATGLIPDFTLDQAANGLTGTDGARVVWKSGQYVVPITSQPWLVSETTARGVSVTASGGDDTLAIQSAIDSAGVGGTVRLVGNLSATAPLIVATAGLTIDLGSTANLTTTSATADAIRVTAANVTIRGGGTITSPATFDGANVQPTYAVIRTTANGTTVDGIRLVNVPKVGIYGDEVDDLVVTGCRIEGNYPAASWTGTQTGHFGVAVNPTASTTAGRVIVRGNTIRGCVQGVFLGNYGAAATAYGAVIAGNIFDGCHNHGVYGQAGWSATSVSTNNFARCSLPIALIGVHHVVAGNVLYTHATGNNLDLAGISMREPVGCVVSGNTVKGDAATGSVVIELGNYTGTQIARNVVSGNTIDVAGGTSIGIRVGRAPQTTDLSDNIIADNYVRSVGTSGSGVITLSTATGGVGNKVSGNVVVVRGTSHGIKADLVTHSTIVGNSVRFEYDAAAAVTLGALVLNSATYCTVAFNDVYNPPTFGTNVSLRGVWEQATSSKNRFVQNAYHGDLTKLAAFTPVVLITNSDAYLDERGTGSPSGAFFGAPGSRWSREDGAAATSLYVKETANTSATWRAV